MHPTFNLECNKVRQDISVKQENIPDKKGKKKGINRTISPSFFYKFRIKSSKVSPPGSKNLPFICCFDFATASTVTLEINIIISSTESLSIRYYLLHLYSQLAFVS